MTLSDEIVFALMSSLAKLERDRKSKRGKRGYAEFRRKNPDKIWGQQPKLRGKKLEDVDGSEVNGVIERETSMYDDDGNLHPAYESEEAGMFGAVTKKIKKELDTFEFMTAMA